MSFRFRNSIRLAPGIKLNLGKKGVSVSAGVRGASVTVGQNGLWGNAGIPGTGISYRTQLNKSTAHRKREQQAQLQYQRDQNVQSNTQLISLQINLDEKGQLILEKKSGEALTPHEKKQVWQYHEADIQQWLEKQCDSINGEMELILNIFSDIQPPGSSIPHYREIPFEKAVPQQPMPLSLPAKPAKPDLTPGFWPRLIPMLAIRQKQRLASELAQWEDQVNLWDAECKRLSQQHQQETHAYQRLLEQWKSERSRHITGQQQIEKQFQERLQQDNTLISEVLSAELNDLDWPRETLVDFEVNAKQGMIYLDIDLPEIEDLPAKSATFGANKRRLLIRKKSARQLRTEYATHIHGVLLRLAGIVFALFPFFGSVVLSGYSQRLDKGTGHINDDYLLSVEIGREAFSQLNFKQLEGVDPVAALERFRLVRKMSATRVFQPVTPLGPESQ